MFSRSAHLYDAFYAYKDYAAEVEQYVDAFRRAELDVEHDPKGLTGRGLYVGIR